MTKLTHYCVPCSSMAASQCVWVENIEDGNESLVQPIYDDVCFCEDKKDVLVIDGTTDSSERCPAFNDDNTISEEAREIFSECGVGIEEDANPPVVNSKSHKKNRSLNEFYSSLGEGNKFYDSWKAKVLNAYGNREGEKNG